MTSSSDSPYNQNKSNPQRLHLQSLRVNFTLLQRVFILRFRNSLSDSSDKVLRFRNNMSDNPDSFLRLRNGLTDNLDKVLRLRNGLSDNLDEVLRFRNSISGS